MSPEKRPPRKPFGERGEGERQEPFGSRLPRRRWPTSPPPPEPGDEPDAAPPPPAGAGDADDTSPDDEVIRVPLVRVGMPERVPDDAAEGEEDDPDEADSGLFARSRPRLHVQGEPPHAPALIRVRERAGAIPPGQSILKMKPEAVPPPGAASPALPAIRFGVLLRTVGVIFVVAAFVATMFTWWTPNTFLPTESMDQLSVALATQAGYAIVPPPTATPLPTATPVPPLNLIGIVSGHRGLHPGTGLPDPGAVCEDGLSEADTNAAVAERTATLLRDSGYEVEVLDEFDPRLEGYQALAMISIHADSCEYINDQATGFKVASFAESSSPEQDARLVRCLIDRYGQTTGLTFHPSVTFDMTQYHSFREVAPNTPGAIIEVGFLYLDRDLLTTSPDVVALGVARGVLCYLREEPVDPNLVIPTPEEEPDQPVEEPAP